MKFVGIGYRFPNLGCVCLNLLAGDGDQHETLFERPTRCRLSRARRAVATAGSIALRRRGQHGGQMGAASQTDWQRQPWQDGTPPPQELSGLWRGWLLERCRAGEFTLRGLVGELAERGLKIAGHPTRKAGGGWLLVGSEIVRRRCW